MDVKAVSHSPWTLNLTLSSCGDVQCEVLTNRQRYRRVEGNERAKEASRIMGSRARGESARKIKTRRGKIICWKAQLMEMICHIQNPLCGVVKISILHLVAGRNNKTSLFFHGRNTFWGPAEAKFVALLRFQIIYFIVNIFWSWLCAFLDIFSPLALIQLESYTGLE